jgi:DNA-binding MarR family transcriptional regulator
MSQIDPGGERLAQLFHRAYDRLRTRIYREAREQGFADLRPAHSSLLRNIEAQGSRVVDLAERAGMTKQSMAYLTDSLAKLGYVEIGPDPDDGRAKRVLLTDRGTLAVATLARLSSAAEGDLARALGASEVQALHESMHRVLAALDR